MGRINNHQQLEFRLKEFSLSVLRTIKKLPSTEENKIYGKQVIRSSSSIGANYAEAIFAHTKADFAHDLNKSRKESKETVYWLQLLAEANQIFKNDIEKLIDEAEQILRIFISSIKILKENNKL